MDSFIKIPMSIIEKGDLTPLQIILLGIIVSLSNKKGKCWASNKYLGDLLGVDARTISRNVGTLLQKGYLEREWTQMSRGVDTNVVGGRTLMSTNIYKGIYKEDISKDISKKDEMFELFWKLYPHYRQGKKGESKKFFLKQDIPKVMKQVVVYKWQVLSGIKDKQFVPACQRWIRDFTELSDQVIRDDLKKIVKWHLNTEGKHERYDELKKDFPDVDFKEITNEIRKEKGLIRMNFT